MFLFGNIKVCAHCLIKFDFVARFGVGARSSSTSHGWQTEQNDVAAAVARARGMETSCPNRTRDNAPSSTAQHAKCTERMWKKNLESCSSCHYEWTENSPKERFWLFRKKYETSTSCIISDAKIKFSWGYQQQLPSTLRKTHTMSSSSITCIERERERARERESG